MVFVWFGRLLAAALMLLGAMKIGLGMFVARTFTDSAAYEAATRRYIGSGTTGDAIDQSLIYFSVGVALGLLAQFAAKRRTGDQA